MRTSFRKISVMLLLLSLPAYACAQFNEGYHSQQDAKEFVANINEQLNSYLNQARNQYKDWINDACRQHMSNANAKKNNPVAYKFSINGKSMLLYFNSDTEARRFKNSLEANNKHIAEIDKYRSMVDSYLSSNGVSKSAFSSFYRTIDACKKELIVKVSYSTVQNRFYTGNKANADKKQQVNKKKVDERVFNRDSPSYDASYDNNIKQFQRKENALVSSSLSKRKYTSYQSSSNYDNIQDQQLVDMIKQSKANNYMFKKITLQTFSDRLRSLGINVDEKEMSEDMMEFIKNEMRKKRIDYMAEELSEQDKARIQHIVKEYMYMSLSDEELANRMAHMKTIEPYALLAANCYPDEASKTEYELEKFGFARVTPEDNKAAYDIISKYNDKFKSSSYSCSLYKQGENYFLAFAGTDNLKEVLCQWGQGSVSPERANQKGPAWLRPISSIGLVGLVESACLVLAPQSQSEIALEMVSELKANGFPMDKMTVIGHSLGGRLATEVALNHDVQALTFNTANVSMETKRGVDKERYSRVTNYKTNDDILNNTLGFFNLENVGKFYESDIKIEDEQGLFDGHKMWTVRKKISKELEIMNSAQKKKNQKK